jgi:DNA-binding NarL/FixJ family response regulator
MMVKDKISIILVDDNKVFIEGLHLILSKCPIYNLLDTCSSGLELLKNQNLPKANLILMNIPMPAMNAIETSKKVYSVYPNLNMIALTMHLDKVFLEDIYGAGFKGFIYKPEVSKKLNGVVQAILNKNWGLVKNLNLKEHNKNGGAL